MKKKLIISILVISMLLASFGIMPVRAENGPSDLYAFICFASMEDYRSIYDEGTIDNEAMAGVTYDLATNTLTLNNVDTNMVLECNKMGDDFKLNLVGDNSIAMIDVYGDEYGGNLTITGNGTLTVDTDKFGLTLPEDTDEEQNAIVFYAEGTSPVFTVENTATVNIHAFTSVVKIIGTTNSNGNSAIVLKNGQSVTTTTEKHCWNDSVTRNVVMFDSANDVYTSTYELFMKDGVMYGAEQSGETAYRLIKSPIYYSNTLERFFTDPKYDSMANGYDVVFDTKADLIAAGYEELGQEATIRGWCNAWDYNEYTDSNGNNVIYISYYSDGDYIEYIYDITDETFTFSDGEEYYIVVENTEHEAQYREGSYEIEAKYNVVETDTYDVKIASHSLTIPAGEAGEEPGEDPVEEPVVINENLKVEASDNEEETIAAKDEVLKVLNDIVNADEGTVEGVDEELANKVREKVEAGETIFVEVVTTPVVAEDIEEEAKAIEEGVTSGTIASYYDVTIVLSTENEELGTVTALKKAIEISLDIPEGLPEVPAGYTRVFKGYRYHNGTLEEVETKVDGNKAILTTDEFSTYALAYEDVKEETTTGAKSNPKTGDYIGIYFTVMTFSVLGFAAMSIIKRK